MKLFSRKLIRLLVLGVAAGVTTAASAAEDAVTSRYPYDPACAWGRIADGKGMIVRCLSEQEVTLLVQGKLSAGQSQQKPAKTEEKPSEQRAESQPAAPPGEGTNDQPSAVVDFDVNVGAVVADKGNLTGSQLHIASAKDKYTQCLKEHGGLQGKTGEVEIRFLVRERGRAEGVSVKKHSSVTLKAAKCVANVVDRRYVGVPQDPVVGGGVTIKFEKR
jgi:hypothetical protein